MKPVCVHIRRIIQLMTCLQARQLVTLHSKILIIKLTYIKYSQIHIWLGQSCFSVLFNVLNRFLVTYSLQVMSVWRTCQNIQVICVITILDVCSAPTVKPPAACHTHNQICTKRKAYWSKAISYFIFSTKYATEEVIIYAVHGVYKHTNNRHEINQCNIC